MSGLAAQTRTRDFPGTLAAAEDAEEWLSRQSRELGLPSQAEFAVNLCLEEIFLNAVKHGRAKTASVSVRAGHDGVSLEFVDDGEPFDPTEAPARRICGPVGNSEIGGYGLGLLGKFSRRMSYRRDGERNRLVLEFDANAGR